jgi:hypothetical protein
VTSTVEPDPASFLSGETGHVAGIRRTTARRAGDALLDLLLKPYTRALDRLAESAPPRRVRALSVYRPESKLIAAATAELSRSRHRLELALGSTGEPTQPNTVRGELAGGKFENLNELLGATGWETSAGAEAPDWLVVFDDDVVLPPRFLDRFIAVCEHFELALAQPAQTLMSHAAWGVTRRHACSLARETHFVEIGPVTAFRGDAAAELTPFPALRYGWGLDLHWGALARERGWRLGIVDALPVRHEAEPVGSAYSHAEAIAEAQRFLTSRPYVTAQDAQRTIATHRRLRR